MENFDTVIIGSGPGGYVAAVRAAQLGQKTAIIEKRETLGGTCLNVGCIPSKALLDSSEHFEKLKEMEVHGITVKDASIDVKTMISRKDKVVSEVCNGVEYLMKKNKITRYHGFGKLKGEGLVEITMNDKSVQTLKAKNIVLATGSVPISIGGIEIDKKMIITSDEAISLKKVPKHLIIIGAGVIGLELGSVWRRLGAKVSVIELLPALFTSADKQIASLAMRTLKEQGIDFYFEHKVKKADIKGKNVIVTATNKKDENVTFEGDVLLVAVGRKPYTENLGLEEAGVKLNERGRILVDANTFETSAKGIYAIGDVIEGPMLAHKAEDEGMALAEMLAGEKGHVNYNAIPWIVYTWPEIAWVGKGEEQLKKEGIEYNVGRSLFRANGRSKAMEESTGMVKILAHKKTDKLLGVFILGPRASDMIAEIAVAFEFGASAEDIARSVHAHPTLSEVIRDAAQNVQGWAIHQ